MEGKRKHWNISTKLRCKILTSFFPTGLKKFLFFKKRLTSILRMHAHIIISEISGTTKGNTQKRLRAGKDLSAWMIASLPFTATFRLPALINYMIRKKHCFTWKKH